MDLKKLFEGLESQLEYATLQMPKMSLGADGYSQFLEDVTATLDLMDRLKGGKKQDNRQPEKEPKVGDTYIGLDGIEDATRVVVFTSDGCSYCEAMKPVIFPILEASDPDKESEHINISSPEGKEFGGHLGINAVPAFLFVKAGKIMNYEVGFDANKTDKVNQDAMLAMIEKYL